MIKDEDAARGHLVSIVMTSTRGRSWASLAAQAGMGVPRAKRLWWQYKAHVLTYDRQTPNTPAYHYHHERFG